MHNPVTIKQTNVLELSSLRHTGLHRRTHNSNNTNRLSLTVECMSSSPSMELHPHTHITPSVSGQAVQATLIGDYSSFETAPNFESKYLAVPGLCACMCVIIYRKHPSPVPACWWIGSETKLNFYYSTDSDLPALNKLSVLFSAWDPSK